MIARWDFMVLTHQQIENINIIFARLRPIDEEPCACALPQSVIYIFGIVREHAKGTISAHDCIRARKAFHQNGGNLELPCGGLTVAAFPRELVNIVNRTKANDIRVKHIFNKGLGILRRLTLVAINAIRG